VHPANLVDRAAGLAARQLAELHPGREDRRGVLADPPDLAGVAGATFGDLVGLAALTAARCEPLIAAVIDLDAGRPRVRERGAQLVGGERRAGERDSDGVFPCYHVRVDAPK
jgi:hypothetical protein